MAHEPEPTRYVVEVLTKGGGTTRIVGAAGLYDPDDPAAMERLVHSMPWLNECTIASYTVHKLRPYQRAWESLTDD